MARHHISEPRVQRVVDWLTNLIVVHGSVNAVVQRLNEVLSDQGHRIYPNRVHGLLADGPFRSINTSTLESLEAAAEPLAEEAATASGRISADDVEQELAAARAAGVTGKADAVQRVAESLGVPPAVVRHLSSSLAGPESGRPPAKASEPDWSWQDDAVKVCLAALRQRADFKAGLIVPTGGGKTRIALRVILSWLASDARDDTVVLWVSHRRHLGRMARRSLQELSRNPEQIPEDASAFFANRVQFTLIQSAEQQIAELGERISLIVVDEAHHAAAPSYDKVLTEVQAPGLFLTATPNRADNLPIGVDEVSYTITYRELFERGCVIEPIFHPPIDMTGLDWSTPDALTDLADFLLERTEQDFNKVLVAVTRTKGAESLYEALADQLDHRPGHPLTADDVGYVHGSSSSTGQSASTFLDEFSARPRGILVGTSQLLGEGFDDPNIDAVVTTYPSSSISHLMQVAGRALRSAPRKNTAHIVQVHESPLEYHFEQRWLYQDISDRLRPEIIDRTFTSVEDRAVRIERILVDHNVDSADRARILAELEEVDLRKAVSVMLSGIHYYGMSADFAADAEWSALLAIPQERERFVHIFNQVSDRSEDIKDHDAFLRRYVAFDPARGSLFKAYVDLVEGMEYARREISGEPYAGANSRPYQPRRSATWLRYFTFAFEPVIPAALEEFLRDAVNRETVVEFYQSGSRTASAAVKIRLPLVGSAAYLLSGDQARWLNEQRDRLIEQLRHCRWSDAFAQISRWRGALPESPLPLMVVDNIDQIIRAEAYSEQHLSLAEPDDHG